MRTTPPKWAVRTEADRKAIAAGYYWDQDAADRIVRFAEAFVAVKYAAGASDQFRLFPWQKRFLQSIYGWRRPNGGRRFRKVLLHVPKKNGKTLIVSVIALYELVGAGVRAPLVASASTTKENAKQVYEQLIACINRNEKLKGACKPVDFRKVIKVPERDGEYRALSADAPNAEGLNCSAVIVDEAHAHRSAKLFRTLEYAMIGRPDGFMVIISTAGDDQTHWYYDLVVRGRNVIAGTDTDPTIYVEIYEADPEKDDLDHPDTWRRINPSLDQYEGFTCEAFRLEWAAAKSNTGNRLTFERYRMNIFRRAEDAGWIDLTRWDQCRRSVPEAELLGCPVWLGVDGSQTTDPSSVSACWLMPGQRYHLQSRAWVAAEGVRRREQTNMPRYQQFEADGVMTITPDAVIDLAAIRAHINAFRDAGHQVKAVVLDGTMLQVFGALLRSDGFEVFEMPQQTTYYGEPVKGMEEAVLAGNLTHDGGAWLRWCVNSVRMLVDSYGRARPFRKKSADKIDGIVSGLMAFSQAYKATAPDPTAGAPPAVFLV